MSSDVFHSQFTPRWGKVENELRLFTLAWTGVAILGFFLAGLALHRYQTATLPPPSAVRGFLVCYSFGCATGIAGLVVAADSVLKLVRWRERSVWRYTLMVRRMRFAFYAGADAAAEVDRLIGGSLHVVPAHGGPPSFIFPTAYPFPAGSGSYWIMPGHLALYADDVHITSAVTQVQTAVYTVSAGQFA